MKKLAILLAAAGAMLFAASCAQELETPFVTTTGVSISPATSTIYTGEVTTLKATLTPSDASSKYMTWTSSDSKVASVDGWGRVQGLAPGEVTISVTTDSGKKTSTAKVTVNPVKETAIALNAEKQTIYVDETYTLKATVTPDNAYYQDAKWTTSDATVATVNDKGVVTGVDYGTCVITATSHFGLTASCNVTVVVRTPTEPETVDIWKADRAGGRGLFGAAADNGKSAGTDGWLSYNNGLASWTANTTGKTRKATLELSTGSKLTVTQLGPEDYKGDWTLYTKLFDGGKIVGGSQNAAKIKVVFGAAKNPCTLKDAAGNDVTNNIGITGLYPGATLDASVAIDYSKQTVKIGVFFDRRSAQACTGGYMAFLPECSTSYWGGYNFAPAAKAFSDDDYDWLWFDLASYDCGKAKYQYYGAGQKTANEKYIICGISCVKATSADASTIADSYSVIFQANYNGSNAESMYFLKD